MSEGTEITEAALEAYNMYVNGITDVKSIAFEMDRSEQWVRENLKRQGITFDQGRTGLFEILSDADKADIALRYNRGEAMTAICHVYHISTGGFYSLLRKMGIPTRSMAKDQLEGRLIQNELALKMYQEGWVIWHITDETGLHPSDILRLVRESGSEMRGQGQRGRAPQKDEDGNIIFQEPIFTKTKDQE